MIQYLQRICICDVTHSNATNEPKLNALLLSVINSRTRETADRQPEVEITAREDEALRRVETLFGLLAVRDG